MRTYSWVRRMWFPVSGVARFGEFSEGVNGDVLGEQYIMRAPYHFGFQIDILVAQEVAGTLEFKLGVYPRQNNRRAVGLGNIVDGTEFETAFFVFGGIQSGDENDRDVSGGGIFAQSGEHGKPSIPGIITSSRIRSGCGAGRRSPRPVPRKELPKHRSGAGAAC